MITDTRFLDMRESAAYLGKTYRWMQANYVHLLKSGVKGYRIPRGSPKGHLMFERESLERYMQSCEIVGIGPENSS